MNLFFLVLTQTIIHAFRKGGGAFGTTAFYIIVITLFAFALGPVGLAAHAGAVMSVAMFLSVITALPLLYERDHEDGTLEQFLLQPVALEVLALAKICGQFFAIIVPMLAVSPLMAVVADLSLKQTVHVLTHLVLASPTLVAIGSVAAALTLGNRRGGLLQALVMMPLSIPVLIFAASDNAGVGLFLCAMLCASLPLSCLVSALLIKMSQD